MLAKMPPFTRKKKSHAADFAAVQAFVTDLAPAPGSYVDAETLYRRFIASTDRVRLPYDSFVAALKLLRRGKVFVSQEQTVLLDSAAPHILPVPAQSSTMV